MPGRQWRGDMEVCNWLEKKGDVLRHFDSNGTEFALVVLDDNV